MCSSWTARRPKMEQGPPSQDPGASRDVPAGGCAGATGACPHAQGAVGAARARGSREPPHLPHEGLVIPSTVLLDPHAHVIGRGGHQHQACVGGPTRKPGNAGRRRRVRASPASHRHATRQGASLRWADVYHPCRSAPAPCTPSRHPRLIYASAKSAQEKNAAWPPTCDLVLLRPPQRRLRARAVPYNDGVLVDAEVLLHEIPPVPLAGQNGVGHGPGGAGGGRLCQGLGSCTGGPAAAAGRRALECTQGLGAAKGAWPLKVVPQEENMLPRLLGRSRGLT